jgi:hypothetical protein
MAPVWVTLVVLGTDGTVSLLSVTYCTRSTLRTVSVKLKKSFVLLLGITVFYAQKKLDFVVLLYRHYKSRQLFGVEYVTACRKDLLRFKSGGGNLFLLESFWTGSVPKPSLDSMRKGNTFPEGKVEGAEC